MFLPRDAERRRRGPRPPGDGSGPPAPLVTVAAATGAWYDGARPPASVRASWRMRMGRKIWLALALAVIVAVSFAAGAVAAKHKAASDPRPKTVTKGLDYFHARQKADGGFGTMAATAWVILGAVASGERVGSTMWTVDGNNPFDYLQAHSHEAAATGPDVDNAPVYYARAIMSYVAADHAERVFVAGTPQIDLLAKLYGYQDLVDLPPTKGSFSPSASSRTFQAVHTTAWAILAMQALGENGTGPVSYTHLRAHETGRNLVCRLLLEKKKKQTRNT